MRNTTHWGKIEGTRPLALCLFSYSKHANRRLFFQASLTFSPVRGELPPRREAESIALNFTQDYMAGLQGNIERSKGKTVESTVTPSFPPGITMGEGHDPFQTRPSQVPKNKPPRQGPDPT